MLFAKNLADYTTIGLMRDPCGAFRRYIFKLYSLWMLQRINRFFSLHSSLSAFRI